MLTSLVGHTLYSRFDSNCACDTAECQQWKNSPYSLDFKSVLTQDFSNIDKCELKGESSSAESSYMNTSKPFTIYLDVAFASLFLAALTAFRFRDLSLEDEEDED